MTRLPLLKIADNDVSTLELFFDLVFVFAVSQLTKQLAADPSWLGAGRTGILLVAVFTVPRTVALLGRVQMRTEDDPSIGRP